MTLEEPKRPSFLWSFSPGIRSHFDANGKFHQRSRHCNSSTTELVASVPGHYGVSVRCSDRVQCINGIQRYMNREKRLGIPIFHIRWISSWVYGPDSATSFPQALHLGVPGTPALVERIFTLQLLKQSSRGTPSGTLSRYRPGAWSRLGPQQKNATVKILI